MCHLVPHLDTIRPAFTCSPFMICPLIVYTFTFIYHLSILYGQIHHNHPLTIYPPSIHTSMIQLPTKHLLSITYYLQLIHYPRVFRYPSIHHFSVHIHLASVSQSTIHLSVRHQGTNYHYTDAPALHQLPPHAVQPHRLGCLQHLTAIHAPIHPPHSTAASFIH